MRKVSINADVRTVRQVGKQATGRWPGRQTGEQAGRWSDRQVDWWAGKQTGKQEGMRAGRYRRAGRWTIAECKSASSRRHSP